MRPVILASGSPRRHALFAAFGIPHRIVVPDVEEIRGDHLKPTELVKRNALLKAQAVAQRTARGVVVAADTVVVFRDRCFGKPRDPQEAKRMLAALSGKTHRVYTGVCVVDLDQRRTYVELAATRVRLRRLSPRQIDHYLRRVAPWDKAGAYAVQDMQGMLIDRIDGSLSNVVGLPLDLVERRLRLCGVFG